MDYDVMDALDKRPRENIKMSDISLGHLVPVIDCALLDALFGRTADTNIWMLCIEAFCIVTIIWVLFQKSYSHSGVYPVVVGQSDLLKRLNEWIPDGLVPNAHVQDRVRNPLVVCSKARNIFTLRGRTCLNLGTFNFLNFVGKRQIEKFTADVIRKYGVGSCGPRGFYGTLDVHLELEERLAEFMGAEDAIVYAYGFSAIASAIPAYAKRGDVIFADEKVNFPIQKGLQASRSKIVYFKHNNWMDLEVLLKKQAALDKKNPQKARKTRKFLIVEGVSLNTGILCDLPQFVKLKEEYKLRLFVDESISFGTYGEGRGITAHFNIPRSQVDLIMGSLEYAMGSVGGFCVGSSYVIEHQRLSGLGYCFSASLPPLHAGSVIKALNFMTENPKIFGTLEAACIFLDKCLRELKGVELSGDCISPVRHLLLSSAHAKHIDPAALLQSISGYCIRRGVAIVSPAYLEKHERFQVIPSLRVCVNRKLSPSDIQTSCNVLQKAIDHVLHLQKSDRWREIVYGDLMRSRA